METILIPRDLENQIAEAATEVTVQSMAKGKDWSGLAVDIKDETGESGCLVYFPGVDVEDLGK